jgi:hypothetical protein
VEVIHNNANQNERAAGGRGAQNGARFGAGRVQRG